MTKVKLSVGKRSLVTAISLGLIILGICGISWAVLCIGSDSIANTFAAESNKLTRESSALVEATDPSPLMSLPSKTLYPTYPSEGVIIGSLTIPVLKLKMPIIQGTGEEELKKGVGHFVQSVLPGEDDNCVLSGHRETVFRQLGKLKIGDLLIVQTMAGTFTYEVKGSRIVDKDDKTVIVPTDHAVLTMTTCYPFDTPGYSPDRYIVSAELLNNK